MNIDYNNFTKEERNIIINKFYKDAYINNNRVLTWENLKKFINEYYLIHKNNNIPSKRPFFPPTIN